MIYEMKYLCSNWEIKTSPFHPNMEILGSFIACINELMHNPATPYNPSVLRTPGIVIVHQWLGCNPLVVHHRIKQRL